MEPISQTEIAVSYVMTEQSIAAYIQHEMDRGASQKSIRNFKRVTQSLYDWLPEDKVIAKARLSEWRQYLKDHGYTQQTELNYIKGINRYLDFTGLSEIRFNRGRSRDITGQKFGLLKAIEPTGEKNRKDFIWRCECKCGKVVEYPATRLLTGHTRSCGCLLAEHLKGVNKYIGGTSIRQSMEERVYSTRSSSGYTGVTVKRGKWLAQIKYKGQTVSLGCYTKLEDAVKARARGKELVQADAMGLLDFYEELHKNDPTPPNTEDVRQQYKLPKQEEPEPALLPAVRSNNTSGHPGVHRKRNKWAAKITYKKITYQLGVYEDFEGALAARIEAEDQLKKDPKQFPLWINQRRSES